MPRDLKTEIGEFVEVYNNRRYHKTLTDPPQADGDYGTTPSGSSSQQSDLSVTNTVPTC